MKKRINTTNQTPKKRRNSKINKNYKQKVNRQSMTSHNIFH